jgi:hypothetical protein
MDTSRLRLGAFATFATLGFAGIAGLIAVFDADSVSAGFGRGFGIALLVFLAGATLTCALACLSGGRAELVALGSIAAAGLGLDLLVLAIWLEIDSEAYGKITGIAFVWAFFALIALGLTLAIRPQERPAQALYGGAVGAAILASLLATSPTTSFCAFWARFWSSSPRSGSPLSPRAGSSAPLFEGLRSPASGVRR